MGVAFDTRTIEEKSVMIITMWTPWSENNMIIRLEDDRLSCINSL